ncbi:MAG: hypothetical protein ACR2PG_04180 [Hyphomicrobiaceae bacterium]
MPSLHPNEATLLGLGHYFKFHIIDCSQSRLGGKILSRQAHQGRAARALECEFFTRCEVDGVLVSTFSAYCRLHCDRRRHRLFRSITAGNGMNLRGIVMRTIAAVVTLLLMNSAAFGEAPQVPTTAPYIVLSENLDEPNGYGFCMDTAGRGKSDLMHTHSCKPTKKELPLDSAGNDTRFSYNAGTGQVVSYAFEGLCMQALIASQVSVFALLKCSDHPRQRFLYNTSDKTFRLQENQDLCVSVASKTLPAGPWVKRPLMLQPCGKVDASLKQWRVVAR